MVRLLILLSVFASVGLAQEIAWGTPMDALRLGVSLDLESATVHIENNGSDAHTVMVGGGNFWLVVFTAVAPDGTESQLLYMDPVSRVVEPILFKLAPGGGDKFVLQLDRIVDPNGTENLESLARRGYQVRAMMKVPPRAPQLPGLVLWGGELTSGVVRGGH